VETFLVLAREAGTTILRSQAVLQDYSTINLGGEGNLSASGPAKLSWAREFSFIQTMSSNQSPVMTLAFPLDPIRSLGVEFDESLEVVEDWDFQLRSAELLGVTSSPDITAIYRKLCGEFASKPPDQVSVWEANEERMQERIRQTPHLVTHEDLERNIAARMTEDTRILLLREIISLRSSRKWKATSFLRLARSVLFFRPMAPSLERLVALTQRDLELYCLKLGNSNSLKFAKRLVKLLRN
jgi:hypothetical protein